MLVHEEDVDEIEKAFLRWTRYPWSSQDAPSSTRISPSGTVFQYPFHIPDDIPRTRRCCGKPMSPAEMARCGEECRMNATWHPKVIGLPFWFEPYTPSPADTAWYPNELKDEARQAFRGIRQVTFNRHIHTNDGQVKLLSWSQPERHVEPWTGCGMWSEWRIPPHFPFHPGFIHPAILQDAASWDKVMWETEMIHAQVAASRYLATLWRRLYWRVNHSIAT